MSSSDSAGKKRKYVRLTSTDWAQVRAEWEVGEASLEELSQKYGVSRRALQIHFRKHSSEKGSQSKVVAREVAEAIFAAFGADRQERVRLGREARATEFDNARRLERLIMTQLEEAEAGGSAAFRSSAVMKAISLATQALERTQNMKWRALGLGPDESTDDLPVIEIVDLTEQEISAMQAKHAEGIDECDAYSSEGASLDDDGDEAEKDEVVVLE
ncbi:MAG: hypothetical protein H6872_01280 [Methylobacteriaceae bacterium]|nr:hypothetical protein [Methylobacteriaceae bacterium]